MIPAGTVPPGSKQGGCSWRAVYGGGEGGFLGGVIGEGLSINVDNASK